jgi:small neutral amino acid transporter SnatA (MarC family)
MNPIGSGFIVNGFLEELDDIQRKIYVKKIIINCILVGVGSLLAGHLILLLFGLAIPVIQLGGGIVICKTGLEWLSDSKSGKTEKVQPAMDKINVHVHADDIEKKLFYPISFPISLGPGSMSVIFTLMASAVVKGNFLSTGLNYAIISLAIVSLLIILYIFLSQGMRIMKKLGRSGNMVLNKLIAFITFCIGIQIIVTGISKIFHLSIL